MGLDKIYDEFVFDMSDEQKKHYEKVKQTWMTQLDNGEFANATIALTAALKLQQISNGFIVSDDGSMQHLENNRIKALDSWLETIPEDEKVVIWVRFKEDARLLMQHFGDKAVDLSGNVSSDERIRNKDLFISDPKIRFVVASPNAAGTGIDNMQSVCNRAVYYATSEHFILRAQSEDRISRIGGSATAFITDLVCRKSPDRKILNNLKGKKELSTMTLDEVRKMFED